MNLSILPADTFIVINKTILTDKDRMLLIMLYQPIIGSNATNLYFSLWAYLDKSEILSAEWTHHHLMTSMRSKLTDIMESREKLEAIGLLRTLVKKGNVNNYIYELYSPLSASEFLNNPILSTTLYNNVGVTEYKKIVSYYKVPRINTKDYEDITKRFSDVFESVTTSTLENLLNDLKEKNNRKLEITPKVDLNNVLPLIPEELLNVRSITRSTKELIIKLSFIYDLDDDMTLDLIRNSLTDRRTIDKDALRRNARNYYQFEHSGKLPSLLYRNQPEYLRKPVGDTSNKAKMIYAFETTTPYDFLNSKIKDDTTPSKRDLKILEYLLVDMNLKPGVVNVLVDYVLRINDNKLNKSFVEAIASQWKMSNIETVEQAMKLSEKEHKKRKAFVNNNKKIEVLDMPEWFDKDIDKKKADKKDIEEMNDLLKEFK